MKLTFVRLGEQADLCPITPMKSKRDWMDASTQRFAYKCVPLVMANTSGYAIACPFNLRVRWNGSEAHDSIEIECLDPEHAEHVPEFFASHFGSGILTFRMPWIIRSDTEGVGVEITGPPNEWIPGLYPLQGLVQAWGHASSATMNWRLMYCDTDFFIPAGYPIAFIRAVDFQLIKSLEVQVCEFKDMEPEFIEDYNGWHAQRTAVLQNRQMDEVYKKHTGAYGKNLNHKGEQLTSNSYKAFRLPSLNVGSGTSDDSDESE